MVERGTPVLSRAEVIVSKNSHGPRLPILRASHGRRYVVRGVAGAGAGVGSAGSGAGTSFASIALSFSKRSSTSSPAGVGATGDRRK
jgi:hypothetical protein